MTQEFKNLSYRSRAALPKTNTELAAWILHKGGLGMIFLALLAVVWMTGEKRNDEMIDLVKRNVAAFQQVSSDLQNQRASAEESNIRMREAVTQLMAELRDLRRGPQSGDTSKN